METTAKCSHCGREVNAANLLIHEARCARMPPPTQQEQTTSATPVHAAGAADAAETYATPAPFYSYAAPSAPPSHLQSSSGEATMVMHEEQKQEENEGEMWACKACTYLNPVARTLCGACDTPRGAESPAQVPMDEDDVRAPDESFTDCLINDDIYAQARAAPPSGPQRSSSFNSLLAGAAVGALGGGLLSYLRGSSMADGMISGAGYGALTSALWNELGGGSGSEEVYRGRPATGPTSYSRTYVTPTGRRTVQVYSSSGGGGGGPSGVIHGAPAGVPPDFFDDLMFPFHRGMGPAHRQLEMMLLRSLAADHGQGADIDNMSYEELLRRFGDRRPRPAASQAIDSLPTRTFTEADVRRAQQHQQQDGGQEKSSCLVCLEDFAAGDEVKTLPCLHMFHTRCIDEWLTNSGVCPVCKFRVDEEEPQNQAA